MEADATEQPHRREMFSCVLQGLKGIGAIFMDEYLGTPSGPEPLAAVNTASNLHAAEESVEECGATSVAASPQALQQIIEDTQQQSSQQLASVSVSSNGSGNVGHADADAENCKPASDLQHMHSMLSPLASGPAQLAADMDEFTRQIEECCMEWRAGRVKPYWLVISEPRFGRTQGCALRIQLSRTTAKVWSADPSYPTPAEAKKACSKNAIEQGVLDFIRYGDGQTRPAVKLGPNDGESFTGEPIPPGFTNLGPWSLQTFYEALPCQMPEDVGDKSAADINAPAWLNTMIQSARGSRLIFNFIWTSDPPFHGALLRLERPGESKNWLVAARFQKRHDAKNAVCLLAMSEGVGDWIRRIIKEVEQRLTPAMRKSVDDILYPTLLTEYRKVRPKADPEFKYEHADDACGCTLEIGLSPGLTRSYTAAPNYRNRTDARCAAIVHAFQEGVIEFIRFQGNPPPPNHIPLDVNRLVGFGGSMDPMHAQSGVQSYRPSVGQKRKNNGDPVYDSSSNQTTFGQRKKSKLNNGQSRVQQQFPLPYNNTTYAPPIPNGMWGANPASGSAPGYPPVTYPAQNSAYNTQTYSPLAPRLTSSEPYYHPHPAPTTGYPYNTPPLYGTFHPGVQAAPAPYNPYQAANHAPPQPAPPLPAPQQPVPTQTQSYSPHTMGAPVMYGAPQPYNSTPVATSTPSYPIPIPQTALYPPSPMHTTPYGSPMPMLQSNYLSGSYPSGMQKRGRGGPNGRSGPKKIAMQSAPKSSVTELYDHCSKAKLPNPEFCHEIVSGDKGDTKHKVWIIIGKQKYQLPVEFNSLSQGQERVARKVLEQLRS